jgi:hypothetical protein
LDIYEKNEELMNYIIIFLVLISSGCMNAFKAPAKTEQKPLDITVSNIQILNHQIIITGTHLDTATTFNIKEGSTSSPLQIESKTSTTLVANALANTTFAVGRLFDFVLANASASSIFSVNFSLCEASIAGQGFNCSITPKDKDVLSYDANTGKWSPRTINGLTYQGALDASSGNTPPAGGSVGDYYIISSSGTINLIAYSVGDWIVLSSSGIWEKISNANTVTNVFGRSGVVVAKKGDYNLTKLADVDLTIAPAVNQILKFNGTNWVAGNVNAIGSLTSITGTAPIAVGAGATPAISIPQATGLVDGYLAASDWTIFKNKQPAFADSAGLAAALLDKTGTGVAVFNAGPSFTGVPMAPTAATNTNTTQIATTAFVMGQVSLLPPSAGSANITTLGTITTGTWNGTQVDLAHGGTGANSAAAARTSLGLGTAAVRNTGTAINTIPMFGANPTVGSLCSYDFLLGFSCNAVNPTGMPTGTEGKTLRNNAGVWEATNALFVSSTGYVGIGTTTPALSLDMGTNTDGIKVPSGTTAQRPISPPLGSVRFNTELQSLEVFQGAIPAWSSLAAIGGVSTLSMIFANQTGVSTTSTITSDTITLSGFVGALTATCSGTCSAIARNGLWGTTTVSGFTAGDTMTMRQTSSGLINTTTNAYVTLGTTVSSAWAVTTSNNTPIAFNFTDVTNAPNAFTVKSDNVTLSGFTGTKTAICSGSCLNISRNSVWQNNTTVSGFVSGDTIGIMVAAPTTPGTSRTAAVSVGNTTSSTWTVTSTASCQAGITAGQACPDGTIYSGLTPDGTVPMYTTVCDSSSYWNGSACVLCTVGTWSGTGSTCNTVYTLSNYLSWNNGGGNYTITNISSTVTGKTNTLALTALSDAGSIYKAATYCATLNAYGHNDWYLPAMDELNILYQYRTAIGNFSTGTYLSSTEWSSYNQFIWAQTFLNGAQPYVVKSTQYAVRCARK